jgi:hypothetical protein
VYQVILGLRKRGQGDLQEVRKLRWIEPLESFGNVAWRRARRIADLIAKLEICRYTPRCGHLENETT